MRVVVGLVLLAACADDTPTIVRQGVVIAAPAQADDLLLDGSTLYWENGYSGGIYELSIDPLEAMPTTLVARDAALSAAAGSPTSIAIADGALYWTNINHATQSGGSVWSVQLSGGAPTALVAGLHEPTGITIIGGMLYFVDGDVLNVVPTQGGSPVEVVRGVREFHLANGRAYWTTSSVPIAMYSLDLSNAQATPTMIDAGVYPSAFTVDSTNLYLRSSDETRVVVTKLPLSGEPASTLFHDFIDDGTFSQRLIVEGDQLYWNARTQLLRIGLDGLGLEKVLEHESDIRSFVVAGDAIYAGSARNDVVVDGIPCACPVIVKGPK